MKVLIDGESIEIKPKCKIRNAEELVNFRNVETEAVAAIGPKYVWPTGSVEERSELNVLLEDLRQKFLKPRIAPLGSRSLASYEPDTQRIQMQRIDGKFQIFGYSKDGKRYLEFYEALFLLELGRLQLDYAGLAVSVEQAYELLLGETASSKYDEYLVYAHLTRIGYILVRHQNTDYCEASELSAADCLWQVLDCNMRQVVVPEHVLQSPHYTAIKANLEQIKLQTLQMEMPAQQSEDIDFQWCLQSANTTELASKGDTSEKVWPEEDPCQATSACGTSLVDLLPDLPNHERLQQSFSQFQIIQLAEVTAETHASEHQLEITFDMFMHNSGFRKSSPESPLMRVVVLRSDKPFPTHADITRCYQKQLIRVPLLLVPVGESRQIQAFLYHFS